MFVLKTLYLKESAIFTLVCFNLQKPKLTTIENVMAGHLICDK